MKKEFKHFIIESDSDITCKRKNINEYVIKMQFNPYGGDMQFINMDSFPLRTLWRLVFKNTIRCMREQLYIYWQSCLPFRG